MKWKSQFTLARNLRSLGFNAFFFSLATHFGFRFFGVHFTICSRSMNRNGKYTVYGACVCFVWL